MTFLSADLPFFAAMILIAFVIFCIVSCVGAGLLWKGNSGGKRITAISLIIQIPVLLNPLFIFYVNIAMYYITVLIGATLISVNYEFFVGIGLGSGFSVENTQFGFNVMPLFLLGLLIHASKHKVTD